MPKVDELQRELAHLKGLVSESELRPVFHLHDAQGNPLRLVTMDGTAVRGGLGLNDVIFRMTQDMFNLLSSGSRYIIAHGGRGSMKSYSIGQWCIAHALTRPTKILCAREVQSSIRESVKSLLEEIIASDPRLVEFFTVQRDWIDGANGSTFLFRGLREYGVDALRSLHGVGLCWIEEAQSISGRSLETLTPTIRLEGSQILMSLNITNAFDTVYTEFIESAEPHPLATVGRFHLDDNPWCPDILRQESEAMKARDPQKWLHVYGGQLRIMTDERVFSRWVVQDFDIREIIARRKSMIRDNYRGTLEERRARIQRVKRRIESDFFVGSDLGYRDVSTFILVYMDEPQRTLYIIDEFYRPRLDVDDLAREHQKFLEKNGLDSRWPVFYDNSRPETIAYLKNRKGLNARACVKLKIVDRIDALQSWDIVVKPGLSNMIKELGMYSWQRDRNGTILPIPEDRNNHLLDALAYALGDSLRVDKPTYKPLSISFA